MAEPLLIGILSDMAAAPPEDGTQGHLLRSIGAALDPLVASGRIDRQVRFVHAYGLGLPGGTAHAIERAYAALHAQGVLAILGPAVGDNALIATPLADRYRIPTINWAGTERARSEWMFHLQVGSHEDETVILARRLGRIGAGRVAVVYDRSPIGRRYLGFFQAECDMLGILIATARPIAPEPADAAAAAEAAAIKAAGADAVIYLGLGRAAPLVSAALRAEGLDLPRLMNTAGMFGYMPGFAEKIDGWTYVDMTSDGNRVLSGLLERAGEDAAFRLGVAYGHDMGVLIGEGLARAPEYTRAGVREGLERIKWLPAAQGHDGTLLGFGNRDHGALHGRYLVLREWRDATSVEIAE